MEFSISADFSHLLTVSVIYLTTIREVYPQSVIDEDFLYTERCGGSSSSSKGKLVQDNIDFIMEELHQQNHENMLLRQEVEDLKSKHEEQRVLLSQLNDLMQALLQKVKLGQTSCPCDVKAVEITTEPKIVEDTTSGTTPPSPTTIPSLPPVTIDQKLTTIHSPVTVDMPTTISNQPDEYRYTTTSTETKSSPNQESTYPIEIVNLPTESDLDTKEEQLSQATSVITSSTTKLPKTVHVAVYPRDCQELLSSRAIFNGRYRIQPVNSSQPFHAYCQLENDTAWTVIQRRSNGKVDFYRNWTDYKQGFGQAGGEFWIGNEKIHQLTKQASYKLRIDMWDWSGNYYYAESSYFYIGNETEYYRFHSPNDYYAYSGFGGSGLRVHRGPFMTFDHQDPSMISDNCAQEFYCGWWFTTCVRNANLNGKYYEGGYEDLKRRTRNRNDVYWHNIHESLKKVEMKLLRTKPWRDRN